MPTHTHIHILARRLTTELNGHAFMTIGRTDITDMLRRVSGEPATRIKRRIAQELTEALSDHGIGVYPPIDQTTTGDTLRLFHQDSIFGHIVEIIVNPDSDSDKDLGEMILKVKGKWRWSTDGQSKQADSRVI